MFQEYVETFRQTHIINPNNGNLYRLYIFTPILEAVKPLKPVPLHLQILEICYFRTNKNTQQMKINELKNNLHKKSELILRF